ncbi:hypothetical protein P3T39_006746 [Kitasatospora sp. GP82]|nr:hypothetical protein [Kitasatospora sp. GP82]
MMRALQLAGPAGRSITARDHRKRADPTVVRVIE